MIYTEVQTLDDVVEILSRRAGAAKRRGPRPMTLANELGLAKQRQNFRSITLSDRVVPAKWMPHRMRRQPPDVALNPFKEGTWDRDRVRAVYAEGFFKPGEIARMAGVSGPTIMKWIEGVRSR